MTILPCPAVPRTRVVVPPAEEPQVALAYIDDILYRMPSDVRYAEVARMLQARGYILARVKGSHHVFQKAGGGTFTVPVHAGKVRYVYVRQIQKLP